MLEDKRTLLVKSALKLFYRHGIHAVGINEVLKDSGVAKKTLYHHFSSKEKLIEETVRLRDQLFISWLSAAMASAEPGQPAIVAMFDAMDDWFNERVPTLSPFKGCFFINAGAEFKDDDCGIYALCQQHKFNVRNLIYPHCQQLSDKAVDVEFLTDQLLFLKEGAIVAAHIMGNRQAAITAKQTALQLMATFENSVGP